MKWVTFKEGHGNYEVKPLGGSGEVAARVGVNSVGVKSVDGEWVVVARCGSVPVCGTAGSAC